MILDFTVARLELVEKLLHNTLRNNHSILLGRNGVGKTHLLIELKRRLRDLPAEASAKEGLPADSSAGARRAQEEASAKEGLRSGTSTEALAKEGSPAIHYIARPIPAKETIESVYLWLAQILGVIPRKVNQNTRIADFAGYIAELLSHPNLAGKRPVLMIDDFDHLPVLTVPIIELLAERITLVAAARIRRGGSRFNRLLWRFEEIRLEPLTNPESIELTRRVLDSITDIKLPSEKTRDFLITRVATLSNGIPSAIVESLDRLRGIRGDKAGAKIDEKFIREIYVHRSAETFFDAAPLILTIFAFITVMRYINRGMYQFDLYAIFGALSGMMLLVRWFMMRTAQTER